MQIRLIPAERDVAKLYLAGGNGYVLREVWQRCEEVGNINRAFIPTGRKKKGDVEGESVCGGKV